MRARDDRVRKFLVNHLVLQPEISAEINDAQARIEQRLRKLGGKAVWKRKKSDPRPGCHHRGGI